MARLRLDTGTCPSPAASLADRVQDREPALIQRIRACPYAQFCVRALGLLVLASLVSAAMAGLLYFKRSSERALVLERDLASVAGELAEMEALEWRAISGVDLDAISDELADSRVDIAYLLSIPQLSGTSGMDTSGLRDALATYGTAVDQELAMLAAGRRQSAVDFDESTVDPALEAADRELAALTVSLQSRARVSGRVSDAGVVGVVLLCLALVLPADRSRRGAERRRRREAECLALHDPLTGLPNRRLFLHRVERTLRRRREKDGADACLLYLDLDDFKAVNDSLGHTAGDELLIEAARRLQVAVSPTDTLCRLGGDEFAVLLEDAEEAAGHRAGERLLALLTEDFAVAGRSVRISASVGVAVLDASWLEAGDVLTAADQAMYSAKRGGKSRVVAHRDDMSTAAVRHAQLTQALRAALDAGEVTVAYQPIVGLGSEDMLGVEALVRWHSLLWGQVNPAEFVALAEESGAIHPLGRHVLVTACAAVADLNATRPVPLAPLTVAVNVSAVQLRRGPGYVAEVASVLRSSGLAPTLLTLEITEGRALAEDCLATLHQVRALGVGIALDDFGTGFASLTHVALLPITQLKIDRSFVDRIGRDGDALAAAVLTLGQQLGLEVVAEGIETRRQHRRLQELGCRQGQGYLFARPVPVEALAELPAPAARALVPVA